MWVYKRDRDFMFVIQGFWWLLLAVWTVLSPILMIDQNTRVSERAEWCDFSVMVPHQYWKVSVHSLSVFD